MHLTIDVPQPTIENRVGQNNLTNTLDESRATCLELMRRLTVQSKTRKGRHDRAQQGKTKFR